MSGYDYSSYYAAGAPPPADAHYGAAQQYGAPPSYGAPPYNAPPQYGHYGTPAPYGAPPGPGGADEVRTIFITGFPLDVKERELNNMMRFMPGYEASQMNWKNGAAQGFALFATGALARSACDAITQLQFDEASTLRCEMARKNMYIKDMEPSGKRQRTGPGGFNAPAPYGGPPPAAGGGPAPYRAYSGGAVGSGGGGGPGDNPPGNTLFVGNLSETVNESELNSIFANQPGFRQLKIVRGRNTTAFVEFDTIDNAIKVHNSQQNAQLASNLERGGIRIQYSRNPFGKKRDITGVMIDTPVRHPDYAAPGGTVGVGGDAPGTGL